MLDMEIIGAFAPRRRTSKKQESECVREAQAEFLTLGGAIILAVCIILTVALFMTVEIASITRLQRAIMAVMTMAAWLYYFDSISEKLRLIDHAIEYRALFGRRRYVPLEELEAVLLVYEGFNLERGIETIEFRRTGRKPDRIALGPCWQRNKLEAFMRSVEEALHDVDFFKNVR